MCKQKTVSNRKTHNIEDLGQKLPTLLSKVQLVIYSSNHFETLFKKQWKQNYQVFLYGVRLYGGTMVVL